MSISIWDKLHLPTLHRNKSTVQSQIPPQTSTRQILLPLQPINPQQPTPHPIFPPHNRLRQTHANPTKHKKRPLPPKRINHNHKNKPIQQFRVREELERAPGRSLLDEAREVDPEFHQAFVGLGEGVDEEHEEEAGVDADVVVPDCADGVDVGAVVCADAFVLWSGEVVSRYLGRIEMVVDTYGKT